jgi:hypothetical protein
VTLLVAGGGSYAVMRSHPTGLAVDTAVSGPAIASPSQPVAMIADSSPASSASTPDLAAIVIPDDDSPAPVGSMDARLGDLNEDQLNALLKDMDNLRAIPASEPEPVSLRVDGNTALEEM